MTKLTFRNVIGALAIAAVGAAPACARSEPSLTQPQQAQLESYQQEVARMFGITPGNLAGPAGGPLTLAEIESTVAELFDRHQPVAPGAATRTTMASVPVSASAQRTSPDPRPSDSSRNPRCSPVRSG